MGIGNRRLSPYCAALAVGIFVAVRPACAITAEEIVANNVKARGGAAALAALHSLRRSGRLVEPGHPALMLLSDLRERPGRIRAELTFQGLTRIRALDGSKAWEVMPFYGRKEPASMTDDDAQPLRLAADLDGAWVDAKAKGHVLEYLGTEEVDGTVAHKLRVRLKWGGDVTVWIDPDTWMVIRDRQRTVVRGAEQETETDYGDYEKVGGVYVPMMEESGPRDSPSSRKMKSIWDKAEANVPVAADAFAFPGGPVAPVGEVR